MFIWRLVKVILYVSCFCFIVLFSPDLGLMVATGERARERSGSGASGAIEASSLVITEFEDLMTYEGLEDSGNDKTELANQDNIIGNKND